MKEQEKSKMFFCFPVAAVNHKFENNYNSLSIGIDIETGGHVFQLHFSNSSPMIEKGFLLETSKSWSDGMIHFGFNISREFSILTFLPDTEVR